MLTLTRRHKRRVLLQRGRGAFLGLFFCCAQSSILAGMVSSESLVPCWRHKARSGAFACCALPAFAMQVGRCCDNGPHSEEPREGKAHTRGSGVAAGWATGLPTGTWMAFS